MSAALDVVFADAGKVKVKIDIKINVNGVGQECPTHMGKGKVKGVRVRGENAFAGHC